MSGGRLDYHLKAAKTLSLSELAQLLIFLEDPRSNRKETQDFLKQRLSQTIHDFYNDEMQISGEPEDRLASPRGPADADLALILPSSGRR